MSGTFQLFNLVPGTVCSYCGVLGSLVAFNLVVAVIARWSQHSEVSIFHVKVRNGRSSALIRFLAGCDTYGGINQLAWLVVGRSQVSNSWGRRYTARI